jgi:hypothetical protein
MASLRVRGAKIRLWLSPALRVKQLRAAELVATGLTYADAGELAGRSQRTLIRWLRDPAPRDQRGRNTNPRRSRASRDAARRAAGHEGKRPTRLADARRRGKGTRGAATGRSRAGRAGAADAVDRRLRPAPGCRPGRAPSQQRRRNTGERRRHAAGQTASGFPWLHVFLRPESFGFDQIVAHLAEPADARSDVLFGWLRPARTSCEPEDLVGFTWSPTPESAWDTPVRMMSDQPSGDSPDHKNDQR